MSHILKVKDVNDYILANFEPFMKKHGFVYKKTDAQFIRDDGLCSYLYNLIITSWSQSISVSIFLYISHKKIEDVFENILGKQRHRLTIGQEMIERIYYSPDGRINGKGESLRIELDKYERVTSDLNEKLKFLYMEVAKPYFQKFTTLAAFDDYINNPPFEYNPAYAGGFTNNRCMKGLIVAKLVNNPNYDKLVAIYDELIKKTVSDVQLDSEIKYNQVKNYLQQNLQ